MAITDKEKGVWDLDEVYNKQNQGGIWSYDGISQYWQWGGAEYGSFGINESGTSPSTRKRKSSPTQLPGTTWQTEFYNAPGQAWHSILTKTDGTLWGFGKAQDWGQLGKNERIDRSSPVQIGTNNNWKAGGTIREGSFAVKTNGTLYTWGSNGYGFGGRNDRTTRSSPAQVGTDTTWDNVWGGHESLFAIKTDGTLWAWGRNGGGELGLNQGPGNEQSSPCQIGTATNWVRCSSSAEYGANGAINSDGELWVWGYNQYGELGQDSVQSPAYRGISAPVQIPGEWQYFQSSGSAGSVGKKTDGTLWAWGGQTISSGATGDATAAGKRSSPCQVGSETNWNRIAAGTGHVVATKTDGTLWLWGSNGSGRLGQNQAPGNLGGVSSPIQVPGTSWSNVNVGGENQSTIATKIV